MLEDNPNPKYWHIILSQTFWAYRTMGFEKRLYRGKSLLSNLWTGCNASNGGGSSFSKGIHAK